MSKARTVSVSERAHGHLRLLALQRKRPMGKVVEDLVEREITELANVWTSPEGLLLQQKALAAVWNDPALDVYGRPARRARR